MDEALSVVVVGAGLAGGNAALELKRPEPEAHVPSRNKIRAGG